MSVNTLNGIEKLLISALLVIFEIWLQELGLHGFYQDEEEELFFETLPGFAQSKQ